MGRSGVLLVMMNWVKLG